VVVLAFFFSARHVLVFPWLVSSKPFQIPPTTDCQQRQSTRASILVHRTHRLRFVSHRYSPSSACAINSQTLGPDPNMPNPQHDVSVLRFREPYAQSCHTTPKGTHRNKTDSLGVRLIWVLLSSRSAIATATRTWREQQK